MSYTSITITKKAANVWFIKDNTTPVGGEGHSSNEWSGTAKNNYITIKTDTGQIIYNQEPYSVFHYVDELDSGNNLADPANPLQLMTHLTQQGFFPDSDSGGGGVDTFLELEDVTTPNYFGRAGQTVMVNEDETGLTTGNPAFDAQNNIAVWNEFGDVIDGEGAITSQQVADWLNLQSYTIVINERQTPVHFIFNRVIGGINYKFIYEFTRGKGTWGKANGAVTDNTKWFYASNLKLINAAPVTIDDIESDPYAQIHDLGTINDGDYITVANEATTWDFTDSGSGEPGQTISHYFSYEENGVTKIVKFIGTPGYYGVDETQFVEADFSPVTNSDVVPEGVQSVTGDNVDNTDPLNPVIGLPNLQQVTNENNVTTNPVGVGTETIDGNVSLLKIGDGVPTDGSNIVAITKTENILTSPSSGNNGLNIEQTGIAQGNSNMRAVRALKSVAYVDPNGFDLTSSGGVGTGVEGVARLIGNNGGTVSMMSAGYFRNVNDSNTATIDNSISVYANNHVNTGSSTINRGIGVYVMNQNQHSNINNSIDIFTGSPTNIVPVITGNWGIYNMSDYYNYFKQRLGIGITTPTEMLEVAGNAKISGTIILPSTGLYLTGGSSGNYINGQGTPTVFAASVQGSTVGTVVPDNNPVTSGDTFKVSINKIQGQLNAKAPLSSPALTDTPTTPTAPIGTNNTQIANAAFVNNHVSKTINSASTADVLTTTNISAVFMFFKYNEGSAGAVEIPAAGVYDGQTICFMNVDNFTLTVNIAGAANKIYRLGAVSNTITCPDQSNIRLIWNADEAYWIYDE